MFVTILKYDTYIYSKKNPFERVSEIFGGNTNVCSRLATVFFDVFYTVLNNLYNPSNL